mgnify:CR=1 FL=1
MRIIEAKSYEDLSKKAAAIISAQVVMKPNAVIGLATGSTPIGTYEQLVELYKNGYIDFSEARTVNLDEYCGLSPDNDQSYRYFMNEKLLNHINIKMENTFLPDGMAQDLEEECKRYDDLIERLGGVDVQLLGIGHNGHIAFNEPSDTFPAFTNISKLGESTIEANSRFFDSLSDVPTAALTVGMKGIMQAKKVLLLANGEDKKQIIEKSLYGDITPNVPASILQLDLVNHIIMEGYGKPFPLIHPIT